ncbi:MAG TPA: hypothetical protein PL185_10635, partial [Flavobacteriales bacterium]|nr:hypothetical protein [Flavobacteriales bacterium]
MKNQDALSFNSNSFETQAKTSSHLIGSSSKHSSSPSNSPSMKKHYTFFNFLVLALAFLGLNTGS